MTRRLLTAAVAALLLTPAAGTEAAGPVRTQVDLEIFTNSGTNRYAIGTLSADDRRCVPDRSIEIYLDVPDGAPFLMDTARTADRGGWMGFRKLIELPDNASEVRLVVLRTKVKVSKHKKIVCGGKTRTYGLGG